MKDNKSRHKMRTYARNRTRLSRRGFDKRPESDLVFVMKLFICVLLGSLWLKFSNTLELGVVSFGGLPVGLMIGFFLISKIEPRQDNRRIFYAVVLICAIISYFVPSGIVL